MLPLAWMLPGFNLKRRTGVDAETGQPTYGALTPFTARVEKKTKLMRGRDGKEITVAAQMVTLTKILYDDQIWLPSIGGEPADDTTSDDNARTPLAIETATNKFGTEVMWTVGFG